MPAQLASLGVLPGSGLPAHERVPLPRSPAPGLQVLWATAAMTRSKMQARREAATSVLSQAAKGVPGSGEEARARHKRLFQQFKAFVEHMVALCDAQPPAKSRSGCRGLGG